MYQRVVMLLSAAGMVFTVACGQSDPGITTAVKTNFAQDDTVKAYQIDVDTADRVVTLSGTVDTIAAKEQAVMVARQTEGVRDVVDQITINPQASAIPGDVRDEAGDARATTGDAIDTTQGAVTDAAVTTTVKSKFLADTSVAGLDIDVDTNGGIVTLTGMAGTQTEADRAVELARETNGVERVVNNIKVGR